MPLVFLYCLIPKCVFFAVVRIKGFAVSVFVPIKH